MADPNKKPAFLGPLVVVSLVVLAVVGFFAARQYFGPPASVPQSAGAAIGGPFTLIDQDGKTVTDEDFRGQYMLVYFGYTYCPDVCPTSLSIVGRALDILEEQAPDQAARIQPVFISVDPDRDTPAVLKDYVKNFHERLIGLTGTPDQVAAAAKAYRVYFAKVREKGAAADEYLMDHSSITYVMGPDGKFATHFGHGTDPAVMAEKLAALK
jgi:protein SCO1/2